MKNSSLLGIPLALALSACQPSAPSNASAPSQTDQHARNISEVCNHLITNLDEAVQQPNFWNALVKVQYPVNQKGSFVRLVGELESFESDPVVGAIAREVGKKFPNIEGGERVTERQIENMQNNLAAVLTALSMSTDPEIRSMMREMHKQFYQACSKSVT